MNDRPKKQSTKVWWNKEVLYRCMTEGILTRMGNSRQLYHWRVHLNLGDKSQMHPCSSLANLKAAFTRVCSSPVIVGWFYYFEEICLGIVTFHNCYSNIYLEEPRTPILVIFTELAISKWQTSNTRYTSFQRWHFFLAEPQINSFCVISLNCTRSI